MVSVMCLMLQEYIDLLEMRHMQTELDGVRWDEAESVMQSHLAKLPSMGQNAVPTETWEQIIPQLMISETAP